MQLELGTDHDHRAAGIVDALAEQVLAEAALLSLGHVGERVERPAVGGGGDAAGAGGIHGPTVRIIHSGLLPEAMKASISLSRLANFFFLMSLSVSPNAVRNSACLLSRSSALSISRIASPPMVGGR